PDMKNISTEAFLGITAIKTCYTTGQQVEVGTANLTNFTTLGNYAFSGNLFERIVFGSDITYIGYQVFQNCKSLKSIELPANIAGVNAEAFAGCAAVTTLTVYNDSLDISGFAAKLTGLIKIIGYSGSPAQEFADGNDAIEFEIFSFPAGVDLYFRLISENDSYTMEIFGEGTTLQAIDASTGEYMAGGYSYTNVAKNATHRPYKDMVTKVKFLTPNLTKINGYYFYDFRKIAEVEFHPDMKNVSTEAFLGITAIKTCYTTGQTPVEGTANLTNFNILESFAFSGNLFEKIVFGSDITTIGYQVFQNCKSLKSIELPANIAGVNAEAFAGCVSVTSLTVYNDKLGVADFAAKLTALETIAAHFGSPAYDYAYETGKNFVLVSANNLLTFEGFQIREENYNGLRSLFSANLVNLNELVEKGFTIVEMGSLIASSDKLEANGEELTVSYEGGIVSSLGYAAKIAVVKNGELTDARTLNSSTSEKLNYACTVINYDQNTYDKFATFRGYIVLEDSNGNSYVYYVDLVDTDGTNYNSTSLDKMVEKFENDGITDLTNNICYVDVKKFRENSMK
ncbi:MAG: leucine-rich repeat protein, partial [Clostridia bacterium]|nr:leucine-rich repeat protein [Clostridia bacterium]